MECRTLVFITPEMNFKCLPCIQRLTVQDGLYSTSAQLWLRCWVEDTLSTIGKRAVEGRKVHFTPCPYVGFRAVHAFLRALPAGNCRSVPTPVMF